MTGERTALRNTGDKQKENYGNSLYQDSIRVLN